MSAHDPRTTADEIGHRVLKLIDSLHGAADLSPEHIAQATGIPVEFNAEDRNIYGFGGSLTGEWSYSLVSTPEKLGEKPKSLRFSFDDTSGRHADPAPICTPGFEAYSQALTAAGYEAKPMRAFPGSDAWYFTRGDIGIMAYTTGATGADDPQPTGRACLSKLVISAYA